MKPQTQETAPPPSTQGERQNTHNDARHLLEAGQLQAAVRAQIHWINHQVATRGAPTADDFQWLGVILFAHVDFAGSARVFDQSRRYDPTWPHLSKNLGMALLLAGEEAAALPELQATHQRAPEDVAALDGLAHVHGRLGRRDDARHWGEQALQHKDAQAGAPPQPVSRWPPGQPFHLMRDNAAHTDLMLAGMWGGVAGWLPPLNELLAGFSYAPGTQARSADQLFLGARVWPRIRAACLVHDSLCRCFGAQPFPPHAPLPPGRHVGDNAAAFR